MKQSRLLHLGQSLDLPNKVPVYFTGKSDYEVKDLTVEWELVPAENLAKAGEFTVRGRLLGSGLPVELSVRVTDKQGASVSDNPYYDENGNQAFASATNDIDPGSHDRVDYINDGDHDDSRRWTNWSATPSANPEVSAGVIFKDQGKIVKRTIVQAKLRFFADSGTDAPSKLVLERYVGPDFDAPVYYSNYQAYEPNHPFNNPDNWEVVPYNINQEIHAGTELTASFNAVKSKAMRWRMERKDDKNGVALTEMTFLAPSELAKESTNSKILVDGKELPDFSQERQNYQVTYTGQRPKITVAESDQVASTVVDSGDDHLPVLVRLVSENGKQVKEYRIQLTKEKPVTGKTAAAVQEELPSLEVLEQELNFQTVEKEDPTLKLGESRVVQEGQNGQERVLTEVYPYGKREEKLREVLQVPTDRIVLIGTKKEDSHPSPDNHHLTPQKPEETGKGETRIVEVENGQSPTQPAAESPAQVPAKAEEEPKAEEVKSEARKASQTDSGRLPNTGNRSAQLAALAGMGLLGLVASLVAKLKKKED